MVVRDMVMDGIAHDLELDHWPIGWDSDQYKEGFYNDLWEFGPRKGYKFLDEEGNVTTNREEWGVEL